MIPLNYSTMYIKKVSILISCLLLGACSWFDPHFSSGLEGKSLPDFRLQLSDSITGFQTSSIKSGQPFVLFLYQPYCPYCQSQTKDILDNMGEFKNIRFYLATSYSYTGIRLFSKHYHLEKYSNITLIRDSANQLLNYFKTDGVPYLAYYDNQKKLRRVTSGKNELKVIKHNINAIE